MNRVVGLVMVAILCHLSTARADDAPLPERYPDGMIQLSVDLVKAAYARGRIVDCPTERCLELRKSKFKGKAALMFVAWTVARQKLGSAAMRAYFASYATKSIARWGLTAVGIGGGVGGILVVSVAYGVMVDAIEPLGRQRTGRRHLVQRP